VHPGGFFFKIFVHVCRLNFLNVFSGGFVRAKIAQQSAVWETIAQADY
jgi:hypothetical protein